MPLTLDRRTLLYGSLGFALTSVVPAEAKEDAGQSLRALEKRSGGRLGVAALDAASGRRIGYRADERFPMCSTHKLLTAAAVLAAVDRGKLGLDDRVSYGRKDLLSYAPVTKKHLGAGSMTVGALCAASVQWSDNTAENLLLKRIGGPAGWTRYARSIGDEISRLDRFEPALNSAIPEDPRDTTTPAAMVGQLDAVLLGKALSRKSRRQLKDWLFGTTITGDLLHAGLPKGWHVGDKSGSGDNGTRNDVGIVMPPSGNPILVAAFYTGSTKPMASQNRVIAEVGRIVANSFGV